MLYFVVSVTLMIITWFPIEPYEPCSFSSLAFLLLFSAPLHRDQCLFARGFFCVICVGSEASALRLPATAEHRRKGRNFPASSGSPIVGSTTFYTGDTTTYAQTALQHGSLNAHIPGGYGKLSIWREPKQLHSFSFPPYGHLEFTNKGPIGSLGPYRWLKDIDMLYCHE